MTDYMTYLHKEMGYESLKLKHLKSFPALGKKPSPGNMDTADEDEENHDEEVEDLRQKLKKSLKRRVILLLNGCIRLRE